MVMVVMMIMINKMLVSIKSLGFVWFVKSGVK